MIAQDGRGGSRGRSAKSGANVDSRGTGSLQKSDKRFMVVQDGHSFSVRDRLTGKIVMRGQPSKVARAEADWLNRQVGGKEAP